jgi:hypothetical protein
MQYMLATTALAGVSATQALAVPIGRLTAARATDANTECDVRLDQNRPRNDTPEKRLHLEMGLVSTRS